MNYEKAIVLAAKTIASEKQAKHPEVLKGDFVKGLGESLETWSTMSVAIKESAQSLSLENSLCDLKEKTLATFICAAVLPEAEQLYTIVQKELNTELRNFADISTTVEGIKVLSMLRVTAFEMALAAFDPTTTKAFSELPEDMKVPIIDWLHVVRKKIASNVARTLVA